MNYKNTRRYLLLILPLFFIACETAILDEEISFEKVAIHNIQIPESLNTHTRYDISFDYTLTNGCMTFYNIGVEEPTTNVREVTAYAKVSGDEDCTLAITQGTYTFQFTPEEEGTYVFKFWKELDTNGNDMFETLEITVTE